MKAGYRVIAYLIAALVAVQAGTVAYATFGLGKYIDGGGTVNANTGGFPGEVGFAVHGMAGTIVIPIVVLAFVVASFFDKVARGVTWAVVVLVCTVVQIGLGLLARSVPAVGILHGMVALALFGSALIAGLRVKSITPAEAKAPVAVA